MYETIENLFSLFAIITGLILCFSYYVSNVRREYQFLTGFLLGDFLSSYYWAVYSFVMGEYPNSSTLMAYFGWNAGYVMLFLLTLTLHDAGTKKYFHPLMLAPIPINIAQFLLYIQYGGYFNNAWQGIFCTAIAVMSIQGILYNRKNKGGRGNRTEAYALLLMFVVFQYAAFTASCFDPPEWGLSPYSLFTMLCYTMNILLPFAIARVFPDSLFEKNTGERADFRRLLRLMFVAIVTGISIIGYVLAGWMKSLLETTGSSVVTGDASRIIMIMLFAISSALCVVVVMIMIALSRAQKTYEKEMIDEENDEEVKALLAAGKERSIQEKSAIMRRWNLILPLLITFLLMAVVVVYTSRMIYKISVNNVYEGGSDKVAMTSVQLENYIDTAKSVLRVISDSVDHMMSKDETTQEILLYLTEETNNQKHHFDENYTGIYGFIGGEYLDGMGWVPPEDYDPSARDWYIIAKKARGEVKIAPPYLDAQTGSMVISICRKLSGDRGVVALDLITNYIQSVTEDTNINDKGYCLIVSKDGTVIAHSNPSKNGSNMNDTQNGMELMQRVTSPGSGYFEMDYEDETRTFFVNESVDEWYVVVVIGNKELFESVKTSLVVNIMTFLIVFILIALFYAMAYRNEERSNMEAQALRIREQQQSYEAEILKLEKSTADAANRAKSSFLADMSHEIRTPINAVLGMNEMILRESESDSITTYARNIESAGKNLLSIINDILDFSKIEAGKMEIVEAP